MLKSDFRTYSNRFFLLLVIIASVALCASFLAQHVFNLKPCKLCLAQRTVYFFVLLFSSAGYLIRRKKIMVVLTGVVLLSGFLISSYHLGVQLEWISDPCSISEKVKDVSSFKAMLETSPSCSKVSWSFLGIPASGLSSLIFLVLCGLTSFLLGKNRR